MTKSFLALIVSFSAVSVYAQPVSLKAGSSVVINGDLISCEGPSSDQLPPACSIKQDGNTYRLYIGSTVAESFYSYDLALVGAKKKKDAGLCR